MIDLLVLRWFAVPAPAFSPRNDPRTMRLFGRRHHWLGKWRGRRWSSGILMSKYFWSGSGFLRSALLVINAL
jgi:hypothetical protein